MPQELRDMIEYAQDNYSPDRAAYILEYVTPDGESEVAGYFNQNDAHELGRHLLAIQCKDVCVERV
jgi:hypothetical protein